MVEVQGYQIVHFKHVQFIVCLLYLSKAVKHKNYHGSKTHTLSFMTHQFPLSENKGKRTAWMRNSVLFPLASPDRLIWNQLKYHPGK